MARLVTVGGRRLVGVVFVLVGGGSLLCLGMKAVPENDDDPLAGLPDYEPGSRSHLRLVTDPETGRPGPPRPDRPAAPPSVVWPPLASAPASGSTPTGDPPTAHPLRPGLPVHPARLWRLLRQVLEVLDGRRPTAHLPALLPADDCQELIGRPRSPGRRHLLRRVRASYPSPRAVEVAAVVVVLAPAGREEVLAAVARFERVGDRWPCVLLRLV